MAGSPDPFDRFLPHLDDPGAYVAARGVLDLGDVRRRASSEERVTVTARSLFLTRDMTVQVSREPIYVASEERFRPPDWHVDTYFGGLGLSAELLQRWADEGAAVLDLASGLGVFATEAASLGLRVDCADAEFVDDHPMFDVARRALPQGYVDQIEFLWCLAKRGSSPRHRLEAGELALLDRIFAARHVTARMYPAPSGRRFRDDAVRLATIADDSYDVVLCGWLLVHLAEEDERRVVSAAVRVTRPGGEVRIRAGTGGSLEKRFHGWFPNGRIGEKRAVAAEGSHEDLLILRVAAGEP